jgi:murein DD-endopeptidase MepM/ murein hydrolase activator NlpD
MSADMLTIDRKTYFAFVLVSKQRKDIVLFRIATWILVLLATIWLGSIGFSSFIISRHINYEMMRSTYAELLEKNAFYAQRIEDTNDVFRRVAKLEGKLEAMLKMRNNQKLIRYYSGEGGPDLADQVQLTNILQKQTALSTHEFVDSMEYLQKNARLRLRRYSEIQKRFAFHRSLLGSRPTSWPVRGWITSRFGRRHSPFFKGVTFHCGLDIANEEGTSVKAPADGVAVFAGRYGSYGKLIVLDHGYGYSTRYGHLHRPLVKTGQWVHRGQVIGFMGNSGRSSAPHLHFEIRLNGIPVNPLKYLEN